MPTQTGPVLRQLPRAATEGAGTDTHEALPGERLASSSVASGSVPTSHERNRPVASAALRERLDMLDRLTGRAHPARLPSAPEPLPPLAGMAPPAAALEPWPIEPGTSDGATLADDDPMAPLSAYVGGAPRETEAGTCWQIDRTYDLTSLHGTVPLSLALDHPIPLRPPERGPDGHAWLDARQAAFFDTETTGLAGGTGTVAFLVGVGWIDGEQFRLRQYVMRDYPEEAAMLLALRQDLGDRSLVSFNGRSYDWPLLVTRWRMQRAQHRGSATHRGQVPPDRPHLDLLVAARRLWARTLHSRSLATLERHVLRLDRGDDLPGSAIPRAYFHYLRTGWAPDIARACRHNEIDVVSMLALLGRVGHMLAEPDQETAHPGDSLGAAHWLVELHDPDRARRCLEVALQRSVGDECRDIHRALGRLCRREGDTADALTHWQAASRMGARFDQEAYEQVTKIYEHDLGQWTSALQWTDEALKRSTHDVRAHAALQHRRERLVRRLAARGRSST